MDPPSSARAGHAQRQPPEQPNQGDHEMQQILDTVIAMPVRPSSGMNAKQLRSDADRKGTGIFNGPQDVMKGVGSPGIAILIWFCGCIYGLSGAHVFLEYGLNVPRYVIDGVEQSVPRSGGELHYLQYVFPRPRYRKHTVMLSGVLFGISFIFVGNMASNCIDCAARLMQIAYPDTNENDFSQGAIRGIAILIATVTCFIHAFSRRGGILLNNAFAVIKVLILVSIIVATWVVAGGPSGVGGLQKGFSGNSVGTPTGNGEPVGHAQAFLSVSE
ncbi:hypothetical protein QQS21_000391 [Conoideocrella luteorostrata]|uniref:Uncharacterized protein n=1 Tax=Conoideocrella luteorostrata TaxID=1105319 RepID=A0AAJ0G3Z9_9HYPO|nr:hypothetical protein QQS21_000391 [Conoideocrella luteorostrata]